MSYSPSCASSPAAITARVYWALVLYENTSINIGLPTTVASNGRLAYEGVIIIMGNMT
jgi:hypothetical protein